MARADYYCTDCGKTHDECYCDWDMDNTRQEDDDDLGPEEGQ
ncbi:hypothetical protein PP304_gp043 [Gordonia phage Phendrix]|nr:hypothetical protein PP304_gp043 [Gordonia phage Phendrix]QDK02591.1 hypothetical protein SEA_PHENDRIX_43 [Gordonia phage Phendrix]